MTNTGNRIAFGKKTLMSLICTMTLLGCEDGLQAPTSAPPTASEPTLETIETDVIAPEAFSISDTALWDGRPTFGGVWIAYPDVEQPERVRIRNETNGKEVIGALYKRERDFPGPKIELSADAASALGVLAGNPTQLTIVALRRKTVTVEVPVEAEADAPVVPTPLRRPAPVAAPVAAPVVAPVVAAAPVTPSAAQTPEVETTTLPPVTSSDSPLPAGTFIQVATLQSQSRADAVLKKLTTAGLSAEIRERVSGSKILYRIVVGPAKTPEALEIMMGVVRELGYKDAIVLG